MLLTKLYDFSQRADIKAKLPIEGYGEVKICWLIEINQDGSFLQFTSHAGDDKANKKGTSMTVPNLIRASNIKPKLLADNGEYVLGISKKAGDKKVVERHQSFKDLVQKCADVTKEKSVIAIAKFLGDWNPETDKLMLQQEEFDPAQNITFLVNFPDGSSAIPADVRSGLTTVENFWANCVSGSEETSGDRPILTCLVTGEEREVEERLPVKIKGIPNGQTAGTALVSANAPPFVSYGLPNCLTSPICREAGEGFAKALNYLIAAKDSRLYLDQPKKTKSQEEKPKSSKLYLNGSIVYVFWVRDLTEDDEDEYLTQDQPLTIKEHLRSIYSTERSYGIEENRFYAIGLSASGGRAVVRDWIDITISERSRNLERWFEAQEIVNDYGLYDERPYLSIKRLTRSLVREPDKEEKTVNRMMPRLVRAALKGESLSLEILAQLVRRNRAERNVTRERAALIKLVLTTQKKHKNAMTNMQFLNTEPNFEDECDRAAYHCGRLLAQLERIQETALGREVNATLIDRFYGAASTTPGKVFGGLVKDAQAHLSRIRKDKRAAYEALQQKLEEILCNISPETDKLPNNLTMQQQSIFALGYYHQRAKNRKDAIDAKEAKNAKANNAEVAESSEE